MNFYETKDCDWIGLKVRKDAQGKIFLDSHNRCNIEASKPVFKVNDGTGRSFVVKCDSIAPGGAVVTPDLLLQYELTYRFITALHQKLAKKHSYIVPMQELMTKEEAITFKQKVYRYAVSEAGSGYWLKQTDELMFDLFFNNEGKLELWYVMDYLDGLRTLDECKPQRGATAAEQTAATAAGTPWGKLMDNVETWKTLGYMLAADMFVANDDRPIVYGFEGNLAKTPLNNVNLFRLGYQLVGLDLMNSNGRYVNLYSNESLDWERHPYWAGFLFHRDRRDELERYSEKLVTFMLGHVSQTFTPEQVKSFTGNLRSGLVSGINRVKKYAAELAEEPRFRDADDRPPQQVLARLRLLGRRG